MQAMKTCVLQSPAMAEYRILIVDDQRDARRFLRSQLESFGLGLQVVEVPSGEEALLVLTRQSFHLLITNLRLAGISGLELLPKARKRQPELRAILVLSVGDKKLEDKIAASNLDSWVYKPVHASELLAAVMRSLNLATGSPPAETDGAENRQQANLAERLGGLRQELDALSVNLLDDNGQIIAQAGNGKHAANLAALIPALMATYSAAEKVTLAMGSEIPRDVFFFSGTEFDLCFAHVGQLAGLLVISSPGAWEEMEKDLLQALHKAAGDVGQILTDMGLLVAQIPENLIERAPVEAEADSEPDLGELELILQQADQGQLEAADIDRFWDDLVQKHTESKPPGTGELSYDQAHQIGLTPEET